jgi:hypothetical protein
MKIVALLLFTSFTTLYFMSARAQSKDPATLFYEGYLVLKSHTDTLRGTIQMGSSKYGKDFVVLKTDSGTMPMAKAQVDFIRLYYKSGPDSTRKFTDFKPINFEKNIFWRLLGSGKADVYDNELFPETERYYLGKSLGDLSAMNIYDLIVVGHERAGIERIPASSLNWGVPKKRNHFILEYINKRYNSHFSNKDFPTNADMVRFIVEHG